MYKDISILGSTGSIGVQTLDVCAEQNIQVHGLSAGKNIDLLEQQVYKFKPEVVSLIAEKDAAELRKRLDKSGDSRLRAVEIGFGDEGAKAVAQCDLAECVVSAFVGIAGLVPTLHAISAGKDVALANKETLVAGGSIVTAEATRMGVKILPVDSEHSAIFQCLFGNNKESVRRILLTASGGPFRCLPTDKLIDVTAKEALKHPNWVMGNKVTIDSATLMNKGLEMIEARWLFGVEADSIDILIHPQSIVHSMVEFCDHSVMAQLGLPDMRLPIQVALGYPERKKNSFESLDLFEHNELTFEKPDFERFPCLRLAYEAVRAGGTMPCVMNAANEIAVERFLRGQLSFYGVAETIESAMGNHHIIENPTLKEILDSDARTREFLMQTADR